MKGFTLGVLVAAGLAGLWAAQRSRTQRQVPAALPGPTNKNIANVTARPAASAAQDSIDPKIVVNPPPPRKPGDPSKVKPSHEV